MDEAVVLVDDMVIPVEVGDARAALDDVVGEGGTFQPVLRPAMTPERLHAPRLHRRRRWRVVGVIWRGEARRMRSTTRGLRLLQHLRRRIRPLVARAWIGMLERIHPRHLRHLTLHPLNLAPQAFAMRARLHLSLERVQSLRQFLDVSLRRPPLHRLAGEGTGRVGPRARGARVRAALVSRVAADLLAPAFVAGAGDFAARRLVGGRVGVAAGLREASRAWRELSAAAVGMSMLHHGRVVAEVAHHAVQLVPQGWVVGHFILLCAAPACARSVSLIMLAPFMGTLLRLLLSLRLIVEGQAGRLGLRLRRRVALRPFRGHFGWMEGATLQL